MAIDGIIFERVKNMGLEFIFLFPYILYLWIHILELFIELYADINKKLHLLNYWCYRIIKSVNTEYEVNEDLFKYSVKYKTILNDKHTYEKYLKDNNWIKCKQPRKDNNKRCYRF